MDPNKAFDFLTRGAAAVHSPEELKALLAKETPLRVKFGIDPTAPCLHLGHVVLLRALRRFQDQGHVAILLFGSFTARIGDPSGRDSSRPVLTEAQISESIQVIREQARRVLQLDRDRLWAEDNRQWFSGMPLGEFQEIAGRVTVAQLLARADFAKRLEEGHSLSIQEFLYPVLQAHDSVVLNADVEIGGTDQTFNMLLGRDLQVAAGQRPQVVITFPILRGADGAKKMSKSLGNHVAVDDPSAEMFGKVMSIPDALMAEWFQLLTDIPEGDIPGDPRDAKEALAREIVRQFHGADASERAAELFRRVFSLREAPEEMPEVLVVGQQRLDHLIVAAKATLSNSEARRLIEAGAVELDGIRLTDPQMKIMGSAGGRVVLRVGKRRFVRLVGVSEETR